MTGKQSGRKQLYVSQAIQGRILRRIAFYWVLYHVVLWHVLFLSHTLQTADYTQTFIELYRAYCSQHFELLLVAAAAFPFIFWDMLKLTNRVAGPFVRFERALKRMTRGEQVSKVKIRDGDLVYEFADVFNEFIEARNRELEARSAEEQPAAEDPSASANANAGADESQADEPALSMR